MGTLALKHEVKKRFLFQLNQAMPEVGRFSSAPKKKKKAVWIVSGSCAAAAIIAAIVVPLTVPRNVHISVGYGAETAQGGQNNMTHPLAHALAVGIEADSGPFETQALKVYFGHTDYFEKEKKAHEENSSHDGVWGVNWNQTTVLSVIREVTVFNSSTPFRETVVYSHTGTFAEHMLGEEFWVGNNDHFIVDTVTAEDLFYPERFEEKTKELCYEVTLSGENGAPLDYCYGPEYLGVQSEETDFAFKTLSNHSNVNFSLANGEIYLSKPKYTPTPINANV